MFDYIVLILNGALASSVALTRDMLATAERLTQRANTAPLRWQICSIAGGDIALNGGLSIATQPLNGDYAGATLILPGLNLHTPEALQARMHAADAQALIPHLIAHHRAGGHIAASCSAVFLLNAAGLLAGRRVTTAWWLAPLLQSWASDTQVDADRMICADGNITTAGAAYAQIDLMLHLLRERCGSALAEWVSKFLLIDGRQLQSPFIVPEVLSNANQLIARLTAHIEAALPSPPSVTALAQTFCMSERTLARHIYQITGKSPLALIQSVRIRHARQLLENSRMSIEAIAHAVGYQDATALRRMMKKTLGVTPGRYRPSA